MNHKQRQTIMKTLENLTIGTKLEMINQSGTYGLYSNIFVSDIKETKSGRLSVMITRTYTSNEGEVNTKTEKFGNGALSKKTLLLDYNYIVK